MSPFDRMPREARPDREVPPGRTAVPGAAHRLPLGAGNAAVARLLARQPAPAQATKTWEEQLEDLLPKRGMLGSMYLTQKLIDLFGPELEGITRAIYADPKALELVRSRGFGALLALGETSPGHQQVDAARAEQWLKDDPHRYDAKNWAAFKKERSAVNPATPGVKAPTFAEALEEGATVLSHDAGLKFGLSVGTQRGPDANDGYDARDWDEPSQGKRVIVSKVEPWLAFNGLVKNIGKPVAKKGGGTTFWSTDCFEHVVLLRTYAYWRTLSRVGFNTRFASLALGFDSPINKTWEDPALATKPGMKPFKQSGEPQLVQKPGGGMDFEIPKTILKDSWRTLLENAPVGSQVIWTNEEAKNRCAKDPGLGFCNYANENTTKLGRDRYAAHPFGITDEKTIKHEMAKAVVGDKIPPGYIEKNIYISAIRVPKPEPGATTAP